MIKEFSLDSKICDDCVEENFLKKEIKSIGKTANCSFCNDKNKTVTLSYLSDRIETVFEQHFYRTSTEPNDWEYRLMADKESTFSWDRDGQTINDIMINEFGIVAEAANVISQELHHKYYDHDSAQIGEESDFDLDAQYELKGISNEYWENIWTDFNQTLKTEARYFSPKIISILQTTFNGIENFRTYSGKSVLTKIGPEENINGLFRARVFQNNNRLLESLCYPDQFLGPPPSAFATNGRMNAKGISVFYGALNRETAIAEVRPPVGSDVAVAKFDIIRPLQLLDLRELMNIHEYVSVFDPKYKQRTEKARFLNKLSEKMTSAVMPDDESADYLPTQVIAEYLSSQENPVFDGIIFNSVQIPGKENTNIVLFHKSSRVKKMEYPKGTLINATDTDYDVFDTYKSYHVTESIPSRKKKEENILSNEFIDNRLASLSIDLEEITVNKVSSVVYTTKEFHVSRTRRKQIKISSKRKFDIDF